MFSLPEFVGLNLYKCIFDQKTIEYVIQELFYLDFTFSLLRHLNKVEYIPELLQCTNSVTFFNFDMTKPIKRFYIRCAACAFL